MQSHIVSRILNQAYFLFILIVTILILISIFLRERLIDIHIHDTKFVISLMPVLWIISVTLILGWAIYRLTNKFLLTKYLTWFHVIATLLVFIFFIGVCLWQNTSPTQEVSWKSLEEELQREQKIFLTISIVFILAQTAFIINLVGGFLRRLN